MQGLTPLKERGAPVPHKCGQLEGKTWIIMGHNPEKVLRQRLRHKKAVLSSPKRPSDLHIQQVIAGFPVLFALQAPRGIKAAALNSLRNWKQRME